MLIPDTGTNLYDKSPISKPNNGWFSVKIDPFDEIQIKLISDNHFTGTDYITATLANYLTPDANEFYDFILTNSEIDMDGNLTYIMFLASQRGLIEIDVTLFF